MDLISEDMDMWVEYAHSTNNHIHNYIIAHCHKCYPGKNRKHRVWKQRGTGGINFNWEVSEIFFKYFLLKQEGVLEDRKIR